MIVCVTNKRDLYLYLVTGYILTQYQNKSFKMDFFFPFVKKCKDISVGM